MDSVNIWFCVENGQVYRVTVFRKGQGVRQSVGKLMMVFYTWSVLKREQF